MQKCLLQLSKQCPKPNARTRGVFTKQVRNAFHQDQCTSDIYAIMPYCNNRGVFLCSFYVHGTVHLSNNSFIKIPTRCNLFCLWRYLRNLRGTH